MKFAGFCKRSLGASFQGSTTDLLIRVLQYRGLHTWNRAFILIVAAIVAALFDEFTGVSH